MNKPMKKKSMPVAEENSDEQQDDAAIGRAFKASLLVIGLVALIVAGIFFALNKKEAEKAEVVTKVEAPTKREVAKVELPKIPLVDITKESGIDFVHFTGKEGQRLLPETMGGGGGFFDYDNDGDQDILLVNGNVWPWAKNEPTIRPTMQLYANDGTGKFSNVTETTGMNISSYGMGCAFGDYDADGWTDVYITNVGENILLRNNQGKFEDVTAAMGVGGGETWSCPAMWFDYDRDGRLDLLVGNYVEWSRDYDFQQNFTLVGLGRAYGQPTSFNGTFMKLFHQTENGFVDVSEEAGLMIREPSTNVPVCKSLAFALVDANDDAWPDIVVANDTVRNLLLVNEKNGTFNDRGVTAGIAFDNKGAATGAMGVDTSYFRNDDKLAIAIANFANEPTSFFVGTKMQFRDSAVATGLGPQTRLQLTFGLMFVDLDLDGRQDIVCTNGHLEEEIAKVQPTQQYKQPPQVFWNASKLAPSEWTPLSKEQLGESFDQPMVGRGSAYADIDGDGDIDLLLVNNGERPFLFRNDNDNGNHWLRIRLSSSKGNREAIGASVIVKIGDQTMQRTISPTRSYLSQSELTATFGLGQATKVDSCEIVWPDGTSQKVEISEVDKELKIEQTLAQ